MIDKSLGESRAEGRRLGFIRRHAMTVGELREALVGIPDGTPLRIMVDRGRMDGVHETREIAGRFVLCRTLSLTLGGRALPPAPDGSRDGSFERHER